MIAGTTNNVLMILIRFSFSLKGKEIWGFGIGSRNPYAVNAMHKAPRGRLIPKQARQLKASVKTPPMNGADTNPIDWKPPITAPTRPSLARGKQCLRILYFPVLIAQEPMPAIARPMTKAFELGANVHSSDPASKMTNPRIKTDLSENIV